MNYDNFTKLNLFENPEANVLGNQIMTNILRQKNDNINFCITGDVARYIQDSSVGPIKVISFITDQEPLFIFFRDILPGLLNFNKVIKLSNQAQIESFPLFVECFYTTTALNVLDVDDFDVQALSDIPSYII